MSEKALLSNAKKRGITCNNCSIILTPAIITTAIDNNNSNNNNNAWICVSSFQYNEKVQ